ncbi:ARO10 [Candida pseudojiufengensis]|uniref:ARO10 n=1 Tax=Candida pseudojiufengensis TaxID=497109 RepID=UPI0022244518|nr:ARO10 [Candida pseudojiufengensis]KAI5960977.1 ARO10 [Candida pseudojiufengensis]
MTPIQLKSSEPVTPIESKTTSPILTSTNPINQPTTPIDIPSSEIAIGEYIFHRIMQSNPKLKSIFAIPGDFNLNLLEHAYSPSLTSKNLKLVNTCNELNGAYVADGYSKVIDGLSVFISTFGVGELSALNGISNAFSEYGPVLHIVGSTSIQSQIQQNETNEVLNTHHLVPNHDCFKRPDHHVYQKMVGAISCVQESLDYDMNSNLKKIDNVLKTIIQERRPGYLFVPCDVPDLLIDSNKLYNSPFSSKSKYQGSEKSTKLMKDISNIILTNLYDSSNPSVLADALSTRFGATKPLNEFINNLPNSVKLFTTNFSRNVDESKSNFIGVYSGNASSDKTTKSLFENSDFVLVLGYWDGEMNTGGHSSNFNNAKTKCIIHPDYIQINDSFYLTKQSDGERLFTISEFIEFLNSQLDTSQFKTSSNEITHYKFEPKQYSESKDKYPYIPQSYLNDHFSKTLKENDIFIVDTMSFAFGLTDIKFPKNTRLITGMNYGSIGYALPATFGATVALNDLGTNQRVLLVQGDGGAQMTIQELSSFMRYSSILKIQPKIYLLNNDGYTIERKINGATRPYNDICGNWKWFKLLDVWGGEQGKTHDSIKLNNIEEFDKFFDDSVNVENRNHKLQFYEVIGGKFDVSYRVDNMMTKN